MSGVSPTMNPMSNLPLSQRAGEMFNGGKIISNAITPREKESSVSEATVETTITGSPSDPPNDVSIGKRGRFYNTELSLHALCADGGACKTFIWQTGFL